MSKIEVLVGSVRKGGNTETLVQAFVDGAKENNQVEVISVADYNVNPCIGCNSCFTKTDNQCFQNDDMAKIYDKLSTADLIVIASPVYFYGISAKLKAIVDRLHNPIRNKFKVSKLALLLVGADTIQTLFDSIKVQYKSVCDYFNLEDVGSVLVNGVEKKGAIQGNEGLKKAYMLGKSLK